MIQNHVENIVQGQRSHTGSQIIGIQILVLLLTDFRQVSPKPQFPHLKGMLIIPRS